MPFQTSTGKASRIHRLAINPEPDNQRELRRRAAIINEFRGQDFTPAIDELVKEASKMPEQRP